MKQGKTMNKNKGALPGEGSGVNKRDAAKAPASSKPSGSKTVYIKKNVLARSSGSLKGYK